MPLVQGTAVATFSSGVPITLQGEWSIDVKIPASYHYGQGDGTPGSGYIGGALGTGQSVSGAFNFVVDKSGNITKEMLQQCLMGFFSIDWPIGDPALGQNKGRAIDCHLDVGFKVNNPEGQYTISGQMKAGAVEGPMFQVLGL